MSRPRSRPVNPNVATPLRVAYFLRGLDGVFLRPPAGVTLFALVSAGTDQESFARRNLPADAVLPFRLRREHGPYPTTEELLRHSDVAAILRRHRVGALFLSSACSAGTWEWSQRHRVRLLMTEYTEQRRLEDKIWFDRFLQRYHLPRPAGTSFRLGRDPLPLSTPAVLQIADSMGGEGTFFLKSAHDLTALQQKGMIHPGQRYLLRRYISGRPFGITIYVGERDILLSALRLQCYYPTTHGSVQRGFAGIQWVASADLSDRLRRRVNRTFLALGQALHRRRSLGFANVDFMVDAQDRIFILECNARMSAATPQLLAHPDLIGGDDVGQHFLQRAQAPGRCSRSPRLGSLPDSDFVGATLDLVAPAAAVRGPQSTNPLRVQRAYRTGRYLAREGGWSFVSPSVLPPPCGAEISMFFFAERGQVCAEDDTLATILSPQPLYDSQGSLLPLAQQILAHFRPTARIGSRPSVPWEPDHG